MTDVSRVGSIATISTSGQIEPKDAEPLNRQKHATISSSQVLRRAASLYRAECFKDADVLLREAIVLDQKNPDLWSARGVMMAAMRRYIDALWCYRESLRWNPKNIGAWTNLGNAYTQLKQTKCAI